MTQLKRNQEKTSSLKNKVAHLNKFLHNRGMINKLLNNFWFNCAFAAYQGACTGLVTVFLILSLIDYIF